METQNVFFLVLIAALISCTYAQNSQKSNSTEMMEEDTSVERKKNDGMEQMYMMVMMFKTFISTIMSFISPIIQIKSFGLSVIGTLINLVRLVIMVKQQSQGGMGTAMGASWDGNRRYVTLAPHSHSHPVYYSSFGSGERGV